MALSGGGRICLRPISTTVQVRCYSAPAERSIPAAKQKYVPTSGTYPKGFLAGSAYAGVKASNTKYDDVALVVSEKPCAASAVFTHNHFKAAPCLHSKKLVRSDPTKGFRGVVINSGCANAITGMQGRNDAYSMAAAVDKCYDESENDQGSQTLVMSTGVIGQMLPIQKITEAIPKAHASLGSTHEHWMRAAQAICTTDTFPKLLSRTFNLPSHPQTEYRIAGMTKGAGMIHPNMGTLLGIICTDVNIEKDSMLGLLQSATNKTFNRITIDGDTSTNDTVAFFANGAAAPADARPVSYTGNPEKIKQLEPTDAGHKDTVAFARVFKDFMLDLAKLVVRDGEGATKFVTVKVRSDVSHAVSRTVAMSVAKSSLVKTALYGKDANWGRILCAIGYTEGLRDIIKNDPQAKVSPDRTSPSKIRLDRTSVLFIPSDGSHPLKLLTRGEPEAVDEVRAREILEMEDLEIAIMLNDDGTPVLSREHYYEDTVYTCDLSHEYVTINGDYRT